MRYIIDQSKDSSYTSLSYHSEALTDRKIQLEALQLDTEEIYEYTSDESPAASHGDFTATSQMLPDPQLFVLLPGSTHLDLAKLGPLPSHIPLIWQTYKENIDPITKIVHIPTVERMLNQDPDKLPPAMRALTHAIYFASAASMDEDEVRMTLNIYLAFSHCLDLFLLIRSVCGNHSALTLLRYGQASGWINPACFLDTGPL